MYMIYKITIYLHDIRLLRITIKIKLSTKMDNDNNQAAPIHLVMQDAVDEKQYEFIPSSFDDYIGQEKLKEKLKVYTTACKMRNDPLDHMLLFGPPGLGKTTLCQIMANIMDVDIKICSGPMLDRTGDLVAILSNLQPHDILFIDEIHRTPTAVEEVLYSAMEQFKIDVIIGQGAGAKTVTLPLQPFTLIGATTKVGSISAPLRSRFGIIEHIDFYNNEELSQLILQNAKFLEITIDLEAAQLIAKCSRGTPRIAKKLLRRIRDFAQVTNNNQATMKLVEESMEALGIDSDGLTVMDNLLLSKIINHHTGVVGIDTLSSLLGEDKETIESVYEPYLIRQGFLEKSSKGRQIPYKKIPYLKKKYIGQHDLFSIEEQ